MVCWMSTFKYNAKETNDAVGSQWVSVIQRITGIDHESLTLRHGPCPKCGGKDRWRLTSEEKGSAICNQCGKFGDGFAVVQWYMGISFPESLKLVAECVGVQPQTISSEPREKLDPAKNLEFHGQSAGMAAIFCIKKKGIKLKAIFDIGGQYATYRNRYPVFAIPAKGQNGEIVGYCIYGATGKDLPIWEKGNKEPIEWRKIKVTAGSQPGWVGMDKPENPKVGWKTEGPSCLLALISLGLPEGHFACCNLFGAEEDPASSPWMLDRFKDVPEVFVVHDCDKSGQSGATHVSNGDRSRAGWAPALANVAGRVRNYVLPYPMVESHGKDLRDLIIQRTAANNSVFEVYQHLMDSAGRCDKIEPTALKATTATERQHSNVVVDYEREAIDDPHRLARLNLEKYQSKHKRFLKYWKQGWYNWKDGVYEKIDTDLLLARLTAFIKIDFDASHQTELDKYITWRSSKHYSEKKDKGPPKVRKVTENLAKNVLSATKGIVALRSSQVMNTWITKGDTTHCVAMANGILDIGGCCEPGKIKNEISQVLSSHSSDWFSLTKLEYPFDLSANCPRWKAFMAETMDSDQTRIDLIQEWMGYLLWPSTSQQKWIIFEGEGGNGKGGCFAVVRLLLGDRNISNVTIDRFDRPFDLCQTIGKAVNISADLGELDKVAEGNIKQFTGGDVMSFDRKNRDAVSAKPTAKLMAAWNSRPRINDRSSGMWRRMIIVPFDRKIQDEKRIIGMDDPAYWSREASGIFNWSLVGLNRLLTNGRFTISPRCEAAIAEFREASNPTAMFLEDHVTLSPSSTIGSAYLYRLYREWSVSTGHSPLSETNFGREFLKKFPTATKTRIRQPGTGIRVYEYRGVSAENEINEIFETKNKF